MGKQTDLTLSLRGITENDGKTEVIDFSQEHNEAVFAFTVSAEEKGQRTTVAMIGSFGLGKYCALIGSIIANIGEKNFLTALALAKIEHRDDGAEKRGVQV